MARPNQEAIETFMSITGVSEATAIQKLEEHGSDLNASVNAHFSEEDRNRMHQTSVAAPLDDVMDIDVTSERESRRPPFSLLSSARLNPVSLLDRNFSRRIFGSGTDFTSHEPFVSHPGEVREIPIEVKDVSEHLGNSVAAPTIEDVTGSVHAHGPEIHGTVTSDGDDSDSISNSPIMHTPTVHSPLSAPGIADDIEEEMIRAAIEASKRDAGMSNKQLDVHSDQDDFMSQQRRFDAEDPELVHAISLSLETAEREKALRELEGRVGEPKVEPNKLVEEEELRKLVSANGRLSKLEVGSASIVLDDAMFGGIPEGSGYHFPYASHQLMQNGVDRTIGPYSQRIPSPPSPSVSAQPLLQEQKEDEHLSSLQADREKELRAKEEAEAALAEERRKEEKLHSKMEEEQEIERQLTAKEASLPQEPAPDDENAVALLVRMPDGGKRGRRFLKSDKLQYLFDFIDVGRVVKPGTYRLVSPYLRRVFSNGERALTLNELGLASRQEALFLELIH